MKSHRHLSIPVTRNSIHSSLYSSDSSPQRFHKAVMNHLPRTQFEIATIAGDRIELLELESEIYARVVNRRTMETGLLPVSVIGAEIQIN
jgi:hypothetical protein